MVVTAVVADHAAVAVELRCYQAAVAADGAAVVVAAADQLSLAWEQVVEVLDLAVGMEQALAVVAVAPIGHLMMVVVAL